MYKTLSNKLEPRFSGKKVPNTQKEFFKVINISILGR